jgi:hypothetical protein
VGARNDYEAAFIPIRKILKSNVLSKEQKLEMIESIVDEILHEDGEKVKKDAGT